MDFNNETSVSVFKQGVKYRGSHCEDVGDVSKSLVEKMGGTPLQALRAELAGLIHDLGHIPFGHAGESVADSIIKEYDFNDEDKKRIGIVRELLYGKEYNNGTKKKNNKTGKLEESICFEHNENSVLRYIILCKKFGFTPDQEIILGILAHSTSRYHKVPHSLVAQAVRLADKLAYINYDVSDLQKSFPEGTEERRAIDAMYEKPLKDPDDNVIKMVLSDNRELTLTEFLKIEPEERVTILEDEVVREAKEYFEKHPEIQADYETYLTGCNDIMVELSQIKKLFKKEKISKEQYKSEEKTFLI